MQCASEGVVSLCPQALQADIASHKDLIDKLQEKAGQVKDGIPQSSVSELQTRYAKLQHACKVRAQSRSPHVGMDTMARTSWHDLTCKCFCVCSASVVCSSLD